MSNLIDDFITPEMIDSGAQRLASFGEESVWPDSWDAADVLQMRILAERVIRSALAEMRPVAWTSSKALKEARLVITGSFHVRVKKRSGDEDLDVPLYSFGAQ